MEEEAIEFSKITDGSLKEKIREILLASKDGEVKVRDVRNKVEDSLKARIGTSEEKKRFKKALQEVNDSLDEEESSDEEIVVKKKSKKRKRKEKQVPKKRQKTSSDESFISLDGDNLKQVRVQTYKGKDQLHIRNYYFKNGKYNPTKRGIALSLDEWANLRDKVDEIQEMVDDYVGK